MRSPSARAGIIGPRGTQARSGSIPPVARARALCLGFGRKAVACVRPNPQPVGALMTEQSNSHAYQAVALVAATLSGPGRAGSLTYDELNRFVDTAWDLYLIAAERQQAAYDRQRRRRETRQR